MNCMTVIASSARVPHCANMCAGRTLDDDDDTFLSEFPSKLMGPPLIAEAAAKVDKCLARLQSLQGTVTTSTAPPASASVSACMSPTFGRCRSCLHGSPRVHEDDKIRIHDVLRWSDDLSGKCKRDHRGKHKRRQSRPKTEVFDDKKDPLDPHGEWKHWSSPAGDVHKVISEILMASQIAKQITSMMNAALVQSDSSADECRKRSQKPCRENPIASDVRSNPSHRVPTRESGEPLNARTSSVNRSQAEPAPTCDSAQANRRGHRRDDPLHKFRVVVATDGPAKRRNSACSKKEVLYPKSKPVPDLANRANNDKEVLSSTAKRIASRANNDSEVLSSAAKRIASRRSPRAAAIKDQRGPDLWTANEITNRKPSNSHETTGRTHDNPPSATRRVRSSPSTRSIVDKPKMGSLSASGETNAHGKIRQLNGASAPKSSAIWSTSIPPGSVPCAIPVHSDRQTLSAQSSAKAVRNCGATALNRAVEPPLPATPSEFGNCVPVCNVLREPEIEGAKNDNNGCRHPSSISESRSNSAFSSPTKQVGGRSLRSNPLIGSLRHKFVMEEAETKLTSKPFYMEATEIKRPIKPWRLSQQKSSKAVLFSNPAFAPPSPPGARPSPPGARPSNEKRPSTPPKSPTRPPSATRRVLERIGRAINSGRRSISPEISRRFNSTRRKMLSLSPRKSLPSLISRLPSRKTKPTATSAPRPSMTRSSSCKIPVPGTGELPLPPGRKAQHTANPQPVRIYDHNSIAEQLRRDYVAPPAPSEQRASVLFRSSSCSRPARLSETPMPQLGRDADWANPQKVRIVDHNSIAEQLKRDFVTQPTSTVPSASAIRHLKTLDLNAVSNANDAGTAAKAKSSKESYFKHHSVADWEKEAGSIGVLSACRKWVEESAPPLPVAAGRYEQRERDGETQKENVIPPAARVNEVDVVGLKSSCKKVVEESVVPAVISGNVAGKLRRSWSTGSRSVSTGKIRSGSSLLKRAREWIRTQTPNRDRPSIARISGWL